VALLAPPPPAPPYTRVSARVPLVCDLRCSSLRWRCPRRRRRPGPLEHVKTRTRPRTCPEGCPLPLPPSPTHAHPNVPAHPHAHARLIPCWSVFVLVAFPPPSSPSLLLRLTASSPRVCRVFLRGGNVGVCFAVTLTAVTRTATATWRSCWPRTLRTWSSTTPLRRPRRVRLPFPPPRCICGCALMAGGHCLGCVVAKHVCFPPPPPSTVAAPQLQRPRPASPSAGVVGRCLRPLPTSTA
jgi:hypothetical protein